MWRKRIPHCIIGWRFPRKMGCAVLMILLFGMIAILHDDEQAIPVMADAANIGIAQETSRILPSGRDSLLRILPTMADCYGLAHGWQEEMRGWAYHMIAFCTDVHTNDWVSVLAVQFPSHKRNTVPVSVTHQANRMPLFASEVSGAVRVGIYHTHTAESFLPSSGKTHAAGGECGEIVEVGTFLRECLAKHGIQSVQSRAIHDYPNFMHAYSASEKTVAEMVKEYPSLDMIFDIHRDASKRSNAAVTIDGKMCAKVLIIVAQGQTGLPQPHWQENYRLAKALEQKMEELYPGLSGGIQLTPWRYNQHLHPHALLLEIGSHETSKGEAMRSAKMMADVIARLLAG